jgi:hypothetical protein
MLHPKFYVVKLLKERNHNKANLMVIKIIRIGKLLAKRRLVRIYGPIATALDRVKIANCIVCFLRSMYVDAEHTNATVGKRKNIKIN